MLDRESVLNKNLFGSRTFDLLWTGKGFFEMTCSSSLVILEE